MPLTTRRAWETDTELGQLLDNEDYYDQCPVLVHIPEAATFGVVQTNTPAENLCRMKSLEITTTASESDIETPPPKSVHNGGIVGLLGASLQYEKKRVKLPPSFLFGRQTKMNDIVLGPLFSQVSRHHFALGLCKGQWAVLNLSPNGTWVNQYFLCGEENLCALHPDQGNEIRFGGLRLTIYCRHPSMAKAFDLWPARFLDTPDSGGGTPATSIASSPRSFGVDIDPQIPRIYYLKNRSVSSYTTSRVVAERFLALDAKTCDVYVAKVVEFLDIRKTKRKLELLQPLPKTPSSRFLHGHTIVADTDRAYVLSHFRDDIQEIGKVSDLVHDVMTRKQCQAVARQLLQNLLRAVSSLHSFKISHGDLGLHSVFSTSVYDCDQLYISGFSEASVLTEERAKKDCLAIFKVVRTFLREEPDIAWLSNEHLDPLWRMMFRNERAWSTTAIGLCEQMNLTQEDGSEMWTLMTISRHVNIRSKTEKSEVWLKADDIREYVSLEVMKRKLATPAAAQKDVDTAVSALKHYVRDDYISRLDFDRFSLHMARHHAKYLGVEHLFQPGIASSSSQSPPILVASVGVKLPYHARYGLISLSGLMKIAPISSPDAIPGAIVDLLTKCYEIRGHCAGTYVSVGELEELAGLLGLEYPDGVILDRYDRSLEHYTHSKGWFLLSPHESSELVPVTRETHLVSGRSSLGSYLKEHMSHTPLDAMVEQSPQDLIAHQGYSNAVHSCTISSSDDSVAFAFSNSKRKVESTRTEDWVLCTVGKRKRSRARQADMIRTEFVKSSRHN
ncbi:hypothetical protein BDP55DRAFT_684987 [Colletotrichum godetiae]|uniref:FHA domain-containing protein n=1 Tax=Colletotrichum godetiae TaxID=1209918 RepID=A0AAJ0A6Y7_9PEZI|nr:uncharacterized protein BDP55DRAFT_684987 [Colletotrichum godetiae]KAK1657669.1 hypothetical protein BDP55DRAFT_684987 [Colletotrichum godetiae]